MSEEPRGFTAEQARALIEKEQQDRVRTCGQQIGVLLKQYNCEFEAVTLIRGGNITQRIDLVAR